jgi:anti-sigma factor RsiW
VPHCDEETLSLLALGESGPTEVEAHIAQCPHCAGELAALRLVVSTARGWDPASSHDQIMDGVSHLDLLTDEADVVHSVHRVAPPSRVWAEIAAHTGVTSGPRPDEVARHAVGEAIEPVIEASGPSGSSSPASSSPDPAPTPGPPPQPVPTPADPPSRPARGPVPPQRRRSLASRLDGRLLTVAAACLVVGLLGGVIGTRVLTDDTEPRTPVLAATPLAGLPAAPTASGQADVVRTASGGRTLDLDVRRLGVADGFYEVWLIDPTVTKMVPVGVLSGGQGRFVLPAGVNLADYPLVDVSIEPLDGNPAHSGKSVLRGSLRS